MSWLVEWDEIAERSWKTIPPQDQQRVSTAVQRFIDTRQGDWKQLRSEPEICGRLYVGDYVLFMIIDESDSTANVAWMYRRSE